MDEIEQLVARHLRHVRLTQRFAQLANNADSVEEGISAALDCCCRTLEWSIGHAFLKPAIGDGMVDSGIWWAEDDTVPLASFANASRQLKVANGERASFLGRAVAENKPQWVSGRDLLDPACFERAEFAAQLNLKCGLALPIRVRREIAGVLELFSREADTCDVELLETIDHIGTELGRVVERERFERDLAMVSQEERRRLGRELHDTLSQQLTGIGMLARSLERKLQYEDHATTERSQALVRNIQDAQEQLRAIARGLNPVDVDAGSLSRAIAEFVAQTEQMFPVCCQFSEHATLDVNEDFTANHLFGIVREAVHNAAKHAHATEIAIETRPNDDNLIELHVRDDGVGFDTKNNTDVGMGLRTLRYRARLIGARLRFHSEPGRGTTVVCSLRPGGHV